MNQTVKQSLILVIVASFFSLAVNLVSPNKIDFIGKFRDLHGSTGPIVPPSAEPGDPPFIDVNEAQMEHATSKTIFVDARNRDEFECGTIPGSINIPFEGLPEGDLGKYFDSTLSGVPKDDPIIVFCSGEECDLSTQLARNLKRVGYTSLAIFFGGAREWEKFGLEMERRKQCGN
jgi:rhodanese-related sulfurtransferase